MENRTRIKFEVGDRDSGAGAVICKARELNMKSFALIFFSLLLLAGCATQEPVEIVEKGCKEEACRSELESLRQKSGAELSACNAARLDAENSCKEKDVAIGQLEQRLQDQQTKTGQAQKALAEKDLELANSRSELDALQQKAKADAVACDAVRRELQKRTAASEQSSARMKELESNLRQRLQEEIGAKNVEIEQLRDQLSVRVLDRILFRSGSAEILPRGRAVLDSVAAAIAGGNETIRIEGHTDSVPIGPKLKSKYFSNWELSTGRASSVARYFENEHVIEPTRMEAVGFSMYRHVAPNDTEENRQRNRRVEIVLTPWKPVVRECAQ